MTVIVCEKNKQANVIAKSLGAGQKHKVSGGIDYWKFTFNGDETYIVHCVGHIVELLYPQDYDSKFNKWNISIYPCIPNKLIVKPKKDTIDCYNFLSKLLPKATLLINATDSDREGELIFRYLLKSLKLKIKWKRAWIPSDLTETKIRDSFKNLKESNEMLPLILSGECRSTDDWLYGMNLTVAMTTKYSNRDMGVLAIGRVKTATLNLVYQREQEIVNHKTNYFYTITSHFITLDNREFDGRYVDEKINNETIAKNIFNSSVGREGTVTNVELKKKRIRKPLLYNTTSLQIACNNLFGWNIERTTATMQSLYDNGYMSYPRTASEYLSTKQEGEISLLLNKLFLTREFKDLSLPSSEWQPFTTRHFDDSKMDSSHTAIVPTLKIPSITSLSDDERQLYNLLAKSVINIIYEDAYINETVVNIDINGNDFISVGRECYNYDKSWLHIDNSKKFIELPKLNVGDKLHTKVECEKRKTTPPKRYTEASLLRVMETAGKLIKDEKMAALMKKEKRGLGTPATRQVILSTLKKQKLITLSGKQIKITDKGIYLIENLVVDEIKSPELTAELEKELNDIATEKDNTKAVELAKKHCSKVRNNVIKYYNEIVSSTAVKSMPTTYSLKCPLCHSSVGIYDWGAGCKNYKSGCKFVIQRNICGKKLTDKQLITLVNCEETNIIKGFKSSKGTTFDAKLQYNIATKKIEFSFPKKRKKK